MREERGFALVEAILLGLVLIVPLIWAVTVLSELQRAAFGATAAVREAGAEIARGADAQEAGRRAGRAARLALEDHGMDARAAELAWASSLTRGASVEVRLRYPVKVFVFPLLGRVSTGPAIWITSSHLTRIDPYGSRDG